MQKAAATSNLKTRRNNVGIHLALVIMLAAACTAIPDIAMAGASIGGPLDDVYTTLTTWTQGSIGKTTMLSFIIVGVVAGIARQSIMAFAVGIGAGLGTYNAPVIVDTVFTAVL
jgi:conjugal transfer pilus assembly protein TraA